MSASTMAPMPDFRASDSLPTKDACVSIRLCAEPKFAAAVIDVESKLSILPRAVCAPPKVETSIAFSAPRPPALALVNWPVMVRSF